MKNKNFFDSFTNAINGFRHTIKNEKNFKVHVILAALVSVACLFLNLAILEYLMIVLVISLVLIAEILNTAIEAIVDLVCGDEHNKYAKIAKDCAAGAVLLSAIASLIVGYFIIFRNMLNLGFSLETVRTLRASSFVIFFIALFLSQTVSAVIKILTNAKNLLKGGMPSMHSASAFSIASSIFFLTDNILIVLAAFALAILIAQSRVEGKIHTVPETIVGAMIGVIVTFIVFQFAL